MKKSEILLRKLLNSKGIEGKELEDKVKEMQNLFKIPMLSKNLTLFNEGALKCLKCNRVVLIGKCCNTPIYCEPKDRYKDQNVKKTDECGIYNVKVNKKDYFIIEESDGVYSNIMYPTIEQAKEVKNKIKL